MTSLPRARRFDWDNLGLRVVSAAILAPAALALFWFDLPFGGLRIQAFLVLVAVAVSLLSIEWAVMIAPKSPWRVAVAMTVAVLAVVFLTYDGFIWQAAAMIVVGALAAAAI